MKVLICFIISVAVSTAMFAPNMNLYQDQGFGVPEHFADEFNGGIGDGKAFDVNDMHSFPDFGHGFSNNFEQKSGSDQNIPSADHFNGFVSGVGKLENKTAPSGNADHENGFVTGGRNSGNADHENGFVTGGLTSGNADHENGFVTGGRNIGNADHENGFVTGGRNSGNADHENGFVTGGRNFGNADHENGFVTGDQGDHSIHIPLSGAHDVPVHVNNDVHFEPIKIATPKPIEKLPHRDIIIDHADHKQKPIQPLQHEAIKFDPISHDIPTPAPIVHNFPTHPTIDHKFPTHPAIKHDFPTHAPIEFITPAPIVHDLPIHQGHNNQGQGVHFDESQVTNSPSQSTVLTGQPSSTVPGGSTPVQTSGAGRSGTGLPGNGQTGTANDVTGTTTGSITTDTSSSQPTGNTGVTGVTGVTGSTSRVYSNSGSDIHQQGSDLPTIHTDGQGSGRFAVHQQGTIGNSNILTDGQGADRFGVHQQGSIGNSNIHQQGSIGNPNIQTDGQGSTGNAVYQPRPQVSTIQQLDQTNDQRSALNRFAPESEYNGGSQIQNRFIDHDKGSDIKLPSVEDLHKHIPTPVVYKPTIAPFIHPDDPVGGPVTVSDIEFDHPDPPKKFTHDDFPSFNSGPSKFSSSQIFPAFSSNNLGGSGSSKFNRQTSTNNQNCPTLRDPSAAYRISSDNTGYPGAEIQNELNRRPELQAMNIQITGQSTDSLDVVNGTDTCTATRSRMNSFSNYGGACFVMPGEDFEFVSCQSESCDQCNANNVQTNNRGLCVAQYMNINVWAFCENAPDANNKIHRERLPMPVACSCRIVQC